VTHVSWGHERFLRRTTAPLGLETWRGTLEFSRRVGHCGASDQVAGLDHLIATGAVGPGDTVMMIGVGIGVSIACAVVRIIEQPAWTDR
jgi:3-oxoacyl-[acyl-carrier-protein] synthase III